MLSLRKRPSFSDEECLKQENRIIRLIKLILPPFCIHLFNACLAIIANGFTRVKGLGGKGSIEPGEISKEFNRRRFEEHLELVKITADELGFTNQVLYQ